MQENLIEEGVAWRGTLCAEHYVEYELVSSHVLLRLPSRPLAIDLNPFHCQPCHTSHG